MLKRTIKYTDFDGNETEEVFYFNLTVSELIEMHFEESGGLDGLVNRIIEAKDYNQLVQLFKKIVLASYGVRSEDGKRFVKTEQLRTEFMQTAAYDALFFQLATDANAGATFVNGVMPPDLMKKAQEQIANNPDLAQKMQAAQMTPPVPPTA